MKVEIEIKQIDKDNSKFDIKKSDDMTFLEVLGVLEIAKRQIIDMMREE